AAPADHPLDELLEHQPRILEVGNHAVSERSCCLDALRRAADHSPSLFTHGQDGLGVIVDRDYRRLTQHYAALVNIDKRVGSAEVDTDRLTKVSFEQIHVQLPDAALHATIPHTV